MTSHHLNTTGTMLALFMAHSGFRFLVLLAGAVAIIYFAWSLASGTPGGRGSRVVMATYTGVLDFQILLGILLAVSGIFYPALLGHILMMVLGAAIAHMASVAARKATEGSRADRIRLIGVFLSLVLIIFGILAIGRSVFGTGAPSM